MVAGRCSRPNRARHHSTYVPCGLDWTASCRAAACSMRSGFKRALLRHGERTVRHRTKPATATTAVAPRTLSRERRNPMDHHEPRAQHSDDRAVAPQRPCATRQLTGLPRLARGGFWLGVALCGVALGGCSGSTSGPVQPTGVGAAAKLVFTVQPSNAAAGAANTPAVQVAVQDAQGNTVTTATTSITVAIGTNPASGTLSGTTTVAAVSGVATLSTLRMHRAGTGYARTPASTRVTD